MSAFLPNKKDLEFEIDLQAHPLYAAQWEPIRNWIRSFRIALSPRDYYRLHRELLNWFYACQKFEEECRGGEREARADIRNAKGRCAGHGELKALSQVLAKINLDRRVATSILAIYRDLGDALVWRVLRYQRPVIAALGQGKVVGRLSEKGLEAEVNEIQWLWESREVFALHADITTCIRHGDVLAFDNLNPPAIYLTESKSSGKFDPNSRQGQRLRRLQELLERGVHPQGADGQPLQFDSPGIPYTTYHHVLRELLAVARRLTYAAREIDSGLALEVWDEANPANVSLQENEGRHAELRAKLGWTDDSEVVTCSAALRRIRSRRLNHNFPSLAPLALTPLPVDDATDLILGRIDFITTLHLPTLEARLGEQGIEAVVARGADSADSFLRAQRDEVAVTVPAPVREQVEVELMQLNTLVSIIDWFLTDVRRRGSGRPHVDLFYEEEAQVWEAESSLS